MPAGPPAQPPLFPERELPAVAPARVPAALRETAARLPAALRLGTSSWSFPGWAGLVWAARPGVRTLARGGLAAYARHPLLRAVGLDRGYYAPLPATALRRYAEQVSEDFRFLVKAPEACTRAAGVAGAPRGQPNPCFLDPGFAADAFVGPALEGLGDRLGTLLFQFPPPPTPAPEPGPFAERLAAFLQALPRAPCAVEIRHAAWLTPEYAQALVSGGAVHCLTVHPRMPDLDAQCAVAAPALRGPLVARWMLGGSLGYDAARDRYRPFDRLVDEDPRARAALVRLCRDADRRGQPALVVVNNKAEGSAPLSVFRLAEAIAQGEG